MNHLIAVAVLAAASTLAHAETSAAKKELVAKVLQLQRPGIETQARGLAERPAAMMMQAAAAAIQQRVPLEKREPMLKEIQDDMRRYLEEVTPTLRDRAFKLLPTTSGAVLEAKFSEAELKQLIAALEAPAFRKYQQSTEEMLRPLGEKLMQESRADLEPRLKALDMSIRKRLEAAQPPAASPAPAKP